MVPPACPFAALYASYLPDLPDRSIGGSSDHVRLRCPFHADKNASAVIYYTTGVFSCPTCNFNLSVVGFISKITGCEYKEADIIVKEYYNNTEAFNKDDSYFSKSPKRNPKWDAMVEESLSLMSPDLEIVKEYLKCKNLKYETLVKAGVGFLPSDKTGWKQDSLVFPYYMQGHVWGIRYRNIQGQKYGEQDTTFALWGLQDVPEVCSSIIIVEGETDRLTAMEMFPGVSVVSTPTCKFKKEWKREFNDITSIICIPQSDAASENLTNSLTTIFGDDIIIIEIPWKRGQIGKDLNDWKSQSDTSDFITYLKTITISNQDLCTSGEELDSMVDDKEFYINNLLSPGQIGAILGPMKAKKTFTMFNMIRTLITDDTPFLGLPQCSRKVDPKHILVVEEEGTKKDLSDRAKLVLAGTDWRSKTTWIHKKGVRLDNLRWINKLSKIIKDKDVGVLFLDCLTRLHSKNEDRANEMSVVWQNVRSLMYQHPKLTVIILHHFGKNGEIENGWNAIRGSSTFGAEIDLALFQEKREHKKDGETIRIKFDGREIGDICDSEGNNILNCTMYVNGNIELSHKERVLAFSKEQFYEEVDFRQAWGLVEAANFIKRTPQTIRNWVEEQPDKYYITRPSSGNPATIMIKEVTA